MPKKKVKSNVNSEVRTLMQEEKRIRINVTDNPERGRAIAKIRKAIREEIENERFRKMSKKIEDIKHSKNPQGEIFKIRREGKSCEKAAFPLKDAKGILQVSKGGIDEVVCDHFKLVFTQNPKPKGEIWKMYWEEIDELFDKIVDRTGEECRRTAFSGPTVDEIKKLISSINTKKSVT